MIAVEFIIGYKNYGPGEIAGFKQETVDFLVENKVAKIYKKEAKKSSTKVSSPDTKK